MLFHSCEVIGTQFVFINQWLCFSLVVFFCNSSFSGVSLLCLRRLSFCDFFSIFSHVSLLNFLFFVLASIRLFFVLVVLFDCIKALKSKSRREMTLSEIPYKYHFCDR